jgi:hypothetical protein
MGMTLGARFHNYEGPTWEHCKPGWYQICIPLSIDDYPNKYLDIVDWIYNNVDKCEWHARWAIFGETEMCFKFRYERNYLMFVLRWS